MSECAVGLSHLVHVFLTLECAALVIESVHDFRGQLVCHGLSAALAGIKDR